MRVSPDNITELKPHQIFVYGDNEAGIHGAGAALTAYKKFGAIWGQGGGLQGQSYGIPTKNKHLLVLYLHEIKQHVDVFIQFAATLPDFDFLVTQIGCGYAGYTPAEIAPLFHLASKLSNVHLPRTFWDVLNNDK